MIQKNDDVEIEQSDEHSDAFAVNKIILFLYIPFSFYWNFYFICLYIQLSVYLYLSENSN